MGTAPRWRSVVVLFVALFAHGLNSRVEGTRLSCKASKRWEVCGQGKLQHLTLEEADRYCYNKWQNHHMAPEKRVYASESCADGLTPTPIGFDGTRIEDEHCPGFRSIVNDGCCECTTGGCLPDLYNSDMFTTPPYSVCHGCNYNHAQACLNAMKNKTADIREIHDPAMPKCDLSLVSFERNINCCYPDDPEPNPFQKFFICMELAGCNDTDLAKSVAIQQFAYGCTNLLSSGKVLGPSWIWTSNIIILCFFWNSSQRSP